MNEKKTRAALRHLPLGEIRCFDQTGSTNDLALAWAANNAPDYGLIIADEQTSGRGRDGRKWFTPAGSALAFSLILHPNAGIKNDSPTLYAGLGALALSNALEQLFDLKPQIKWPNDVLLAGKKIAGILVEVVWAGDQIESMVLGMGVNVFPEAVPPAHEVHFPASSIGNQTPHPVDRFVVLAEILKSLIALRPQIDQESFLQAWQDRLAFQNEWVQVWAGQSHPKSGKIVGLERDGSLRLQDETGGVFIVHSGEVKVRPAGL